MLHSIWRLTKQAKKKKRPPSHQSRQFSFSVFFHNFTCCLTNLLFFFFFRFIAIIIASKLQRFNGCVIITREEPRNRQNPIHWLSLHRTTLPHPPYSLSSLLTQEQAPIQKVTSIPLTTQHACGIYPGRAIQEEKKKTHNQILTLEARGTAGRHGHSMYRAASAPRVTPRLRRARETPPPPKQTKKQKKHCHKRYVAGYRAESANEPKFLLSKCSFGVMGGTARGHGFAPAVL